MLVRVMGFYHQHVPIAVSTITGVTYKNIRNPNNLSKCISEPLAVTKMSQTFRTITEYCINLSTPLMHGYATYSILWGL